MVFASNIIILVLKNDPVGDLVYNPTDLAFWAKRKIGKNWSNLVRK